MLPFKRNVLKMNIVVKKCFRQNTTRIFYCNCVAVYLFARHCPQYAGDISKRSVISAVWPPSQSYQSRERSFLKMLLNRRDLKT